MRPLDNGSTLETGTMEHPDNKVPTADVTAWYTALMNFTVSNRTSRLIYMHPLGAVDYPTVLSSIFTQANTLIKAGSFRWYTMARSVCASCSTRAAVTTLRT